MPRFMASLLALLILAGPAMAQEAPPKDQPKEKAAAKTTRRPRPAHADTGKTFMGREIADVMSYLGADWLVRPEREQEEQPEAMLDALKIKPGDTVADIGAGVGYTSARISKRVGPKGTVLATDVQPQMIKMLRDNMKTMGITNVKAIACTPTETGLPDNAVDLAILIDVYHECSDPVATLKGIRKALKPGGRLVLVEFRAEDPDVPIKPEHKMTVAQVKKEIEPQGFAFKELHDFLPWQHIIIFEKPTKEKTDAPKGAEPAPK
ncbi:MAG: methylase involved in ubiquinone/menaquinone biosynthesis [Planctomycetota bacterium]|nr:methylase involved in ubiquinone/menaquinone biosynthesis [Planctomycetota bacterium]